LLNRVSLAGLNAHICGICLAYNNTTQPNDTVFSTTYDIGTPIA